MGKAIREMIDKVKNFNQFINESTTKSNGFIICSILSEILFELYKNKVDIIASKNISNEDKTDLLSKIKFEYGVDYDSSVINKYKNEPYYEEFLNFLDKMKIHYVWMLDNKKIFNLYDPSVSNLNFDGLFIEPIENKISNNQTLILIYIFKEFKTMQWLFQENTFFKAKTRESIISATIHELQHAFDHYISGGKNKSNKKVYDYNKKYPTIVDRQNMGNNSDYLELPHEINARISQLLKNINFGDYTNFDDLLTNREIQYIIYNNGLDKYSVGEDMYKKIIKKYRKAPREFKKNI